MNKFRVIVAGSRTFNNFILLQTKLDHLLSNKDPKDVVIISGGAAGADIQGETYAAKRGIECLRYPANWRQYGKRAGYLRNEEMANNADALVAFWDGQSRGTKHMIDIARAKGLAVRIILWGQV